MSFIKKTAENLFDDLIKDTAEIPIDIKRLTFPNTSTPHQKPKKRGGVTAIINFNEDHDPLADHIIKQEMMRKEIKEKKQTEVKLKRLLKKCKKVRVRLPRLNKKQIDIHIKKTKKNKKVVHKTQQEKRTIVRPAKRQASSLPSSPNNKRQKLSPGTLKTKAALKQMPKQKIHLKFNAIISPPSRTGRISKAPQKYNASPDVAKTRLKKKKSPKSKNVKQVKVSRKKRTPNSTQPKKQKITKTISKKNIEKKFGKIFLQCHVKVLRNKLDDLDATHLLEKSFKESRKKQKGGVKKSVSFKETVSVDVYDPEPSSDIDTNEVANNINEENVQNDNNSHEIDSTNAYLNDSLESVELVTDDASTKVNPVFSTPPGARSPKTSYSPLKTDLTRRSEILKKSDEKIGPKTVIVDSDDDDFEDDKDIKKINDNDGEEINEIDAEKINEIDDQKINEIDDKKISDNGDIKISDNDMKDEESESGGEADSIKSALNDDLNKENSIETDDDKNNDSLEYHSTEVTSNNGEIVKEKESGSDCPSDINKSSSESSLYVQMNENTTDESTKTETNKRDKMENGKNYDIFSLMKEIENKDKNKDDNISCSDLDGELRLTPDEEKKTNVQTLPLTKPPKSVLASIYESIKSKLPGGQASQTTEKDEDDESFDVPKITELQQFETDDESTLLGDPVLGGRDKDEIVF